MLVDLHLQGRLPLEKFVSETIGLGRREDCRRATGTRPASSVVGSRTAGLLRIG